MFAKEYCCGWQARFVVGCSGSHIYHFGDYALYFFVGQAAHAFDLYNSSYVSHYIPIVTIVVVIVLSSLASVRGIGKSPSLY
jgi:hypothetical protein